jgi:thiol-disulfide isomerase/thioredoxin
MLAMLPLVLMLAARPAPAEALRPFERGSWQELRLQHSGRPVVVHFWGITCGPCLSELPAWGQLIREKPGLSVVMIAADPVVVEPRVIAATLSNAGLSQTESWRFADAFTERLAYEVDPQWAGELPYTLLIGTDGRIKSVLGTTDFSELLAWVEREARGYYK